MANFKADIFKAFFNGRARNYESQHIPHKTPAIDAKKPPVLFTYAHLLRGIKLFIVRDVDLHEKRKMKHF